MSTPARRTDRRQPQAPANSDMPLWVILGINVLVFIAWNRAEGAQLDTMANHFLVSPSALAEGRYWTLLTSAFSHYDVNHLLFNGIALWLFGRIVLRVWGTRDFLALYLVGGVVASLGHVAFGLATGADTAALGASGAVMALSVATAYTAPNLSVLLFFVLPIPMKALVPLYIVIDTVGLLGVTDDGVANAAHLGGVVLGGLWVLFVGRQHPERRFLG